MTIKEQIRQEIERRIKVCEDCNLTDPTRVGNNAQIIELKDLLNFLDTLQESGCRFPQYDNIVEKVFGAGNLESWEYSEAEQLVGLAKEELLESLQKSDINLVWHKCSEEVPTNYGSSILVVCRNKNKEDGIFLTDLIKCWEGKWEPRDNWEDPVLWAYLKDLLPD